MGDAEVSTTTVEERQKLTRLIEGAKWKFAWAYARTYPHEYTTKALCNWEIQLEKATDYRKAMTPS